MTRLSRCCIAAGAIAGLFLGGCAIEPTQAERTEGRPLVQVRDARERSMQQEWVGRAHRELVGNFGSPVAVLDIPGRGRMPGAFIVVYTSGEAVGGCIDAFVVLAEGNQRVWNYFCR